MTTEEETDMTLSLLDDPGFALFNGPRWIDRDVTHSFYKKVFHRPKLVKFVNQIAICAEIWLSSRLWINITGHKRHKNKDYICPLIPSTFCEATKHLFPNHLQWDTDLGDPSLADEARNIVKEVTKWAEENPDG
jgi:hypothetical protein